MLSSLGKFALAFLFLAAAALAATPTAASLQAGYTRMYNLQFDAAHQAFTQWEQSHPDDPMGPVSDAAAYLFSEFNRMQILQSRFFTQDDAYEQRDRTMPDAAIKAGFDHDLARAQQLAQARLARTPGDTDALLAQVLADGLKGDYLALIERRDLDGLKSIKRGRRRAQHLLQVHPNCYDAYLAIGAENYLLGIKAAPVRWLLQLTGAQTDKEEGIRDLRLVAEKGEYLAPYARVLLAIAALRDHDASTARRLLAGLAQEFPRNPLYRQELNKIE
jgi:hypothetical protein